MTTFIASSNLSNRLRTLARTKRHCCETLREYADELDQVVEAYILEPNEKHKGAMLVGLSNARVLYAQVAGVPLTAD